MRLTVNHLLLPLLLLCFHCSVAVKKNSKPGDHDRINDAISLVEVMGTRPKVYLERSEDAPVTNYPLAEFPCPVDADIVPCVCSTDSDGIRLYLDCTFVESEDQLAAVFQQDFPVKELYEFRMWNNSAVKTLRNVTNGITFENLYLYPGPFDLEAIFEYFLLDLKDTVRDITIRDSKLTTETFPFVVLPSLPHLSTLHIIGSNMNGIPAIRASNISLFEVSRSPVERLVDGTISVGTRTMAVNLYNNNLSAIEPGSIFFADEQSATSSELFSVDLIGNKLQSLQAGTFHFGNGIFVLYINSNQINSIEPGTFVLPNSPDEASNELLYIDLAHNQLMSLQAGTFPLRNAAVNLYLDYNIISSIAPGTFVLPQETDAMKVRLDLRSNELTTIDEAVFGELMPFVTYLALYDNPLACGCDIVWLILNTTYMGAVGTGSLCTDGTLLQDLNPQDFVDLCRV